VGDGDDCFFDGEVDVDYWVDMLVGYVCVECCAKYRGIPSYSGSTPSRTAFAMFGFLPQTTIGMADIADV